MKSKVYKVSSVVNFNILYVQCNQHNTRMLDRTLQLLPGFYPSTLVPSLVLKQICILTIHMLKITTTMVIFSDYTSKFPIYYTQACAVLSPFFHTVFICTCVYGEKFNLMTKELFKSFEDNQQIYEINSIRTNNPLLLY